MATLEMAMVPIGIESLMIALLILITGKYKAGSTTPPAANGHSVPVNVCLGNAPQVQTSVPSTEKSSKAVGGAKIPCMVHGYSIRCRRGRSPAERRSDDGDQSGGQWRSAGCGFGSGVCGSGGGISRNRGLWDFSSAALAACIEGTTEHTMREGTAFPKTKSGAPVALRT